MPVDKVRIGTRKPNWNVDPEVKNAKQKANFGYICGYHVTDHHSGAVFSVKQKCKLEYKVSFRRGSWGLPPPKSPAFKDSFVQVFCFFANPRSWLRKGPLLINKN